ncbi:MAG: bile acid:Na+ symporter, family [Tenuifilum sp.]|nr:bile acid:Na+ symporter, family [Tenuifilum sp.]
MFSMTGISFAQFKKTEKVYKPIFTGIFLNYIVFSTILIPLAYFLMPTKELFYGFVVIAATPPGVAIIPFTFILGGNVVYAIISLIGAFLGSIVMAPILVKLFANSSGIQSIDLFWMMIQLVVIPLVLSRFLLWGPIKPFIEKVRGKVVDWGFAFLIFIAVGINRHVFFSSPLLLIKIASILIITIFGLGHITNLIAKKTKVDAQTRIPMIMLVGIKSSGFSVFTALTLFGKEAAIPSAVMAVVVLSYLIFLSIKSKAL